MRWKPTLDIKLKTVKESLLKLKYYMNIYTIMQNIKIYENK